MRIVQDLTMLCPSFHHYLSSLPAQASLTSCDWLHQNDFRCVRTRGEARLERKAGRKTLQCEGDDLIWRLITGLATRTKRLILGCKRLETIYGVLSPIDG